MNNLERSAHYGELQKLVDEVYAVNPSHSVARIDIITRAEIDDLNDDLMEVITLLPGGSYHRSQLCDHINSILAAHGWSFVYGTVE